MVLDYELHLDDPRIVDRAGMLISEVRVVGVQSHEVRTTYRSTELVGLSVDALKREAVSWALRIGYDAHDWSPSDHGGGLTLSLTQRNATTGDNLVWYGRPLSEFHSSSDLADHLNDKGVTTESVEAILPEVSPEQAHYLSLGWYRVQVGYDSDGDRTVGLYTSEGEWVFAYFSYFGDQWEERSEPEEYFADVPPSEDRGFAEYMKAKGVEI